MNLWSCIADLILLSFTVSKDLIITRKQLIGVSVLEIDKIANNIIRFIMTIVFFHKVTLQKIFIINEVYRL